jgi:glucokinase
VNFPYPVLLSDIGGTNVRFAYQLHQDAPLQPAPSFKTKDHPGLENVLSFLLPQLPARPRSLIACIAGPVERHRVRMTNADWTIDAMRLFAEARLEQGLFLNDFEAQALSLPILKPDWTIRIGETAATGHGVRLILGPGTGLGAAALVEVEGRHLALASEAGHMDFGPAGAQDSEFWQHIDRAPLGRVSAETILSGPGLMRLHSARCAAAHVSAPAIDEAELTARALADPLGEEAKTVRHFLDLIARFSGDLALAYLAKGGVTFSGGVLPRLVSFLDPPRFRARFEDKAPYGTLMRGIGTSLIIANEYVLAGMARIAAMPQAYAIDYAARAWR